MTDRVRGYCRDKSHVLLLRAWGLTPKQIYCEGYLAETLAACVASFRDMPGTLIIAAPLDEPFDCNGIRIVGFPATAFEELTDILEYLKDATTLRRLFAALQ